jgi:hypothetical protein
MPRETSTTAFRREEELAAPVIRFLRNRAFRVQGTEIPFFEYRIDVCGYSAREDVTIAIELKLEKWTRAVEQALLYQLCTDLVYIALPIREARRVDRDALIQHGLGLIAVEEHRCTEILKPQRSAVMREHYRNHLVSILCKDR